MSLKRCPSSKLDQWMRWTRREEDAKEAKLMRVWYTQYRFSVNPPSTLGRSRGGVPSFRSSQTCPTRAPGTQYACTPSSARFSKPLSVEKRKRDACRSAFLVRVFFFLFLFPYLDRLLLRLLTQKRRARKTRTLRSTS